MNVEVAESTKKWLETGGEFREKLAKLSKYQ